MWRIEFTTSEFRPYLPEECQANPGVYGFELAQWLSMALAEQDLATSYPLGEDWGWFIEYLDDEREIMIGCASIAEEGDGYREAPLNWSIFIKPQLSLKQRLLGSSSATAAIQPLAEAVVNALAGKGIEVRQVES